MQSEEIVARLQKILAKADPACGATEAEARAAMAAAQRIAIQHNIDLASLSAETDAEIKIETDRADVGGDTATRRLHHLPIAQVLIACFDVRFLWIERGSRGVIVGEKADVAIATYCWGWLCSTYPALFRKYQSKEIWSPHTEHTQRVSFYNGLTAGIITANRREKEAAKADVQTGGQYALVLVKKEDAVEARVDAEFPNAKKARKPPAKSIDDYDRNALSSGYREGKEIKLVGALEGACA